MQKIGGIECEVIAGELTYGLERIAMHLQDKNSIFDLTWSDEKKNPMTYGDIFLESEKQHSAYIFECSNIDELFADFGKFKKQSQELNKKNLPIPAYEQALKASHILNLLDARGVISSTERASYIAQVRDLVNRSCELFRDL
jgi:glycyl-tRNA synthetase alpha chain